MLHEDAVGGIRRIRHGGPEIDADRVVASERVVFALGGDELTGLVDLRPVGGEARGGRAHERADRPFGDLLPVGVDERQAAQDEDRVVARVERHVGRVVKAASARKEDLAEVRNVAHVALEALHHRAGLFFVGGLVPETCGFEKVVGDPEVGVGGVVRVDDAPAVSGLPPKPRGKILRDVALAQILFGPLEELREGFPVVGDEREEHGVGLPFARRDGAFVAVVDHTEVLVDVDRLEAVPHRPGRGAVRHREEGRHGTREKKRSEMRFHGFRPDGPSRGKAPFSKKFQVPAEGPAGQRTFGGQWAPCERPRIQRRMKRKIPAPATTAARSAQKTRTNGRSASESHTRRNHGMSPTV